LVKLTRELKTKGHRKVGMKMLFEVLRWQYMRGTYDPSADFKLNHNYHSRYARHIAENYPDLADVFEVRALKAS
jgi:hypothetical protein